MAEPGVAVTIGLRAENRLTQVMDPASSVWQLVVEGASDSRRPRMGVTSVQEPRITT